VIDYLIKEGTILWNEAVNYETLVWLANDKGAIPRRKYSAAIPGLKPARLSDCYPLEPLSYRVCLLQLVNTQE